MDDLVIKQIDLPNKGADKVAYVVQIAPATSRAPHQANDHRYYKRFNFESTPMEDYEVRDLMRRSLEFGKKYGAAWDLNLEIQRLFAAINERGHMDSGDYMPRDRLVIRVSNALRSAGNVIVLLEKPVREKVAKSLGCGMRRSIGWLPRRWCHCLAARPIASKSAKCGGLETNGPRERISAPRPGDRSAEVCARSPWLLAISARQNPAENVGRGRTGGGSATGIQRSPNLECPNLHMGVRLGSKSCIEKTAEFAAEKFCLSLGRGREPSKSTVFSPIDFTLNAVPVTMVNGSVLEKFNLSVRRASFDRICAG